MFISYILCISKEAIRKFICLCVQRPAGLWEMKGVIFMSKEIIKEKLKAFLPPYAVVALVVHIISNLGVYYGARMINDML